MIITQVLILCQAQNAYAGNITEPPVDRDRSPIEQEYLREIYNNFNNLEIVTTAPDGNRRGNRGDMVIWASSPNIYLYVETATPSGTVWKKEGEVSTTLTTNDFDGTTIKYSGASAGIVKTNDIFVKAWVNFDGGAVDGNNDLVGVNDSYNVSGVVDNGAGDYTIYWDTDFANANYAISGSARFDTGGGAGDAIFSLKRTASNPAAGSARISLYVGGSEQDCEVVCVMAIGSQN